MINQPTLAERGTAAAKRFIERLGYVVLAEDWSDGQCRNVSFVAEVGGKLHLVDVSVHHFGSHTSGPLTESVAAQVRETARAWSQEDKVRFEYDQITVYVSGGDRAFIKTNYDVLNGCEIAA